MLLKPKLSRISALISTLNILVCQAAWVRKFGCCSTETCNPLDGPFRVDNLHGTLEEFDNSAVLSLSILAIHDTARFTCSDLDLAWLEASLHFNVLGIPVGHVKNFSSNCPLPITKYLTPPEGSLFSRYEFFYSLGNAHRLQTIVSDVKFRTRDGVQLECVTPKITPDIGPAASATFTYLAAAVMVLVGIASWKTHANDGSIMSTESSSPWSILGIVWRITLDISEYLRYLQFIFLAASLSLEYPGFYKPIVSKVAWASLLYWTGPINHGFTYPGIEDGLYSLNGTYGLEYMSQTLGFPAMPDIMINSFINLFILIFGVMFGILILLLITSQFGGGIHLGSVTWDAGIVLIGMILSLFSLPLLSFMSYELILVGYLPNYRIIIVGFSIAVIVFSNLHITRHINRQTEPIDCSSPDNFAQSGRLAMCLWKAQRYFTQYLPAAVPLLQSIAIGGLQDWGLVQVLVLMGLEIILLLHMAMSLRGKLLVSPSAWCTVARLLVISLTITFACSSNETTKQWVGYIMLCSHGTVIIFGFLSVAIWRLARPVVRDDGSIPRPRFSQGSVSNPPSSSPDIFQNGAPNRYMAYPLNKIGAPSQKRTSPSLHSSDGAVTAGRSFSPFDAPENFASIHGPTPINGRSYITDFSAFYRHPRRPNSPMPVQRDSQGRSSTHHTSDEGPSEHSRSDTPPSEPSQDSFDELIDTPINPNTDYSLRESDAFYGTLRTSFNSQVADSPGPATQERRNILQEWTARAVETLNHPMKKKEKGFQVMRPPRQG
ncbi:TRP-like family [Penicillium griseofulvum]|uniref:TRP-like family n=1 Tax=Penicillium patulum TaxID=5078 RepID=A0A135LFG3_PENPA|nr:TRP-like family [Penicillium griseofulvum]KXG47685.1 TRP-like family [Penicillium griseofulvum]